MKVSVCVIAYNHGRYLRECLQSIVDQVANFDFEIIVSDDASTDNTAAIALEFKERYPTKFRLILRDKNVGGTENWINVHNSAVGEYVCQCDGDDCWLPGKLSAQTAFMELNQDVIQTWHRQKVIDADSVEIDIFPSNHLFQYVALRKLTFEDLAHSYALVGQHSAQMYRRTARTYFYRDRPTIDYFYALNFAESGFSVHLPDILGCYRVVAGASITQQAGGRDIVDRALMDAAEHFAELYPRLGGIFRSNLIVRSMGARLKRRLYASDLGGGLSKYPFKLSAFVKALYIFIMSKV